MECLDNHEITELPLAEEPPFSTETRRDLPGGVTAIHGATHADARFTAIPPYAWDPTCECG